VVGKVDVTANKLVADRFQIKGYPTVKILSKGEMLTFKYQGSRSKEDMIEFLREANSNTKETEAVPKDFTSVDLLKRWLNRHKEFAQKRLHFAKKDVAAVSHCPCVLYCFILQPICEYILLLALTNMLWINLDIYIYYICCGVVHDA
jgi:hypothetical protein